MNERLNTLNPAKLTPLQVRIAEQPTRALLTVRLLYAPNPDSRAGISAGAIMEMGCN